MRIADTIKQLRTNSGYTQNQLAEKLNCNRQKIADWERGKSLPAADDLVLLSKTFQVSTDYLLGIAEIKTTDKDVQFVHKYTGLSEESIAALHADTIPHKDDIYPQLSTAIDFLLQGVVLIEFTSLCDMFQDYKFFFSKKILLTQKMNDYIYGDIKKTAETYKKMEDLYDFYKDICDKRDVQKLRMQEILTDLLDYYCKTENNQQEKLKDVSFLFVEEMMELDDYLFSEQEKDGEPHGNDQ